MDIIRARAVKRARDRATGSTDIADALLHDPDMDTPVDAPIRELLEDLLGSTYKAAPIPSHCKQRLFQLLVLSRPTSTTW